MHSFSQKQKPKQQSKTVSSSAHSRPRFSQNQAAQSIPHLQRTIGNQSVQRLVKSNRKKLSISSAVTEPTRFAHDFSQIPVHFKAHAKLQPKLVVSTPEDKYEREANLVAEQVMQKSEPHSRQAYAYQRRCPECTVEQVYREQLQPKDIGLGSGVLTEVPPIVHETLTARGKSFDSETRGFMESRFSHDFARVRIHDDARAAEAANAINAKAFTLGHHIAFGAGHYAPHTVAGRTLLAHELAHVVQRSGVLYRSPKRSNPTSLLSMRKPGSKPWEQLPTAVRRVFHDSFIMRLDTEWIWNKQTAEQSYNSWPLRHRKAFDRIYTELIATGLWREVKRITDVFVGTGGSVPGVKFWARDPVALAALLRRKSFCRDTLIYHIARPGGNAKWRQMKTGGTEGLHVTPGIETTVHLDSISPVAGRDKKGDCRYSMRHILPHVSRDLYKGLRKRGITLLPIRRLKFGETPMPGEVQSLFQWRFPMQKRGMTWSEIEQRLRELEKTNR